MYMDGIKLVTKIEKESETPVQIMRIYRDDMGMEFDIEKSAMISMKSGKRQMTEGIESPDQRKIRTLGETKTSKYLGILEADTIKQAERREKI